ncbi:MAG: hypothetical protein JXQ80_11985 [Bacteroidales bacterium]|nr:hypothetical protein [Bacteroidales bacterium]
MIRKINNNCAVCKVILLLVFLGYYSSLTLFYHPHLINGQIVYHSHPYKKHSQTKTGEKQTPAHQHNKDEFFYIQQLDKSVWDDLVIRPDLPEIVNFPKKLVSSELPVRLITTANTSICLRAPPAVILFG